MKTTMYMLTINGQALLTKPMTLADIITSFGSVSTLEKQGYRLVVWNA